MLAQPCSKYQAKMTLPGQLMCDAYMLQRLALDCTLQASDLHAGPMEKLRGLGSIIATSEEGREVEAQYTRLIQVTAWHLCGQYCHQP